jgi:hypothetical protein
MQSISLQAYKLFSKGKTALQVAIAFNKRASVMINGVR